MRRCVECHKRLWPWGSGVDSRFGWIHIRCLDKRVRLEIWDGALRAVIQAWLEYRKSFRSIP
jgi:hypothetical protein